jgi:hypothetical protein
VHSPVTFYQLIEDIVEKENEVKEQLAVFEQSGEVDRTDMANEIEKLEMLAEDAMESARERIN